MYADHQPVISKFARHSADNFCRVATFVVCTIRMPLLEAAKDTTAAIAGKPCNSVFGMKHQSLAWLRDHGADLWEELEYLYETGASAAAMLRAVMRCPGIGLAKGGFILQMCYGLAGCLDSHNLERFGIPARRFVPGDKNLARKRIEEYLAKCLELGGTAYLWDSWCKYLAETQLGRYDSAEQISALHLTPCQGF